MSESDTGSAPPATWTYATRTPRERGADRRHLAVNRAEHDGPAVERSRQPAVLLPLSPCHLTRRVRERHHVRILVRGEPEPAGEIRVEDVEAARAEAE